MGISGGDTCYVSKIYANKFFRRRRARSMIQTAKYMILTPHYIQAMLIDLRQR